VGDFNRNYSYREEGASMSEYKEHGLRGNKRKEVYQSLYEKQGGRCAICEKGIGELSLGDHGRAIDKLFIDHCHETGKIRGLLCNPCNSHLGIYELSTGTSERCLLYQEDEQRKTEKSDRQRAEEEVMREYMFWEYFRRALLWKHREATANKLVAEYKDLVDTYRAWNSTPHWEVFTHGKLLHWEERLKAEEAAKAQLLLDHQEEIDARIKRYQDAREDWESSERETERRTRFAAYLAQYGAF